MLCINKEKERVRQDWELSNPQCKHRGNFSRTPHINVRGWDCEAEGSDSYRRQWEKLYISLEIPLISIGYTIALSCQLNIRDVKAKCTCKSLRPNARQYFFERNKAYFS